MVTTVRQRPSHYDALELTPAATPQEIDEAFARKMSPFRARPLADIAQVTVAYETLRSPAKRREYDRSIGVAAEPEPLQWSFRMAQQSWTPFVASMRTEAPPGEMPPPEPHVTVERVPEGSKRLPLRCGIWRSRAHLWSSGGRNPCRRSASISW